MLLGIAARDQLFSKRLWHVIDIRSLVLLPAPLCLLVQLNQQRASPSETSGLW